MIMRGDRGAENSHVAGIQRFLRRNSCDAFSGNDSFMYGAQFQIRELKPGGRFCGNLKLTGGLSFLRT